MSTASSRPGGLTALAVLNFIFSGLAGLGILGLIAALALAPQIAQNANGEDAAKLPTQAVIVFLIVFEVIAMTLLIISGIGYLKLKKFLGRILGSVYALVAIAAGITSQMLMDQPFRVMTMVGFLYPTLTLILLNTTFKDDFINP